MKNLLKYEDYVGDRVVVENNDYQYECDCLQKDAHYNVIWLKKHTVTASRQQLLENSTRK